MMHQHGCGSCARPAPQPACVILMSPRSSTWAEAARITSTQWNLWKERLWRVLSVGLARLEVKLALEIAAQVAAGLAAVHEQNLVHRDIKPANIMVSLKDGNRVTAKIIDLGLSKAVTESPSQPAISMPGAFAGTPEFASPEQFAGVGVDIRSDLYSLGVTLWEMLRGKVPFRGTPAEVMYQHQHAPLPLEQLIELPQPIVVLLQLLLEKDPQWRVQNPTELVDALPKVNDAIKARCAITDQDLRTSTDKQ